MWGADFTKDSDSSFARLSAGIAASTAFSQASGRRRRCRGRINVVDDVFAGIVPETSSNAGRYDDNLFHCRILSRNPNCSSVNDADAIFPGV